MSKRSSDTGPDGEPDQISSPRSAGSSSKSQRLEGQGHVGSGVTKETLKNMLLEKEAKLQKLQKEKKQLLQTVRRQETKIGKLQEELSETKGRKDNSLDVVRVSDSVKETGKSGSWFTPAGSISLAASRFQLRFFFLFRAFWTGTHTLSVFAGEWRVVWPGCKTRQRSCSLEYPSPNLRYNLNMF